MREGVEACAMQQRVRARSSSSSSSSSSNNNKRLHALMKPPVKLVRTTASQPLALMSASGEGNCPPACK